MAAGKMVGSVRQAFSLLSRWFENFHESVRGGQHILVLMLFSVSIPS